MSKAGNGERGKGGGRFALAGALRTCGVAPLLRALASLAAGTSRSSRRAPQAPPRTSAASPPAAAGGPRPVNFKRF